MDAVCPPDSRLRTLCQTGEFRKGGYSQWAEQHFYFVSSCAAQCNPSCGSNGKSAPERSDAEYFGSELSRTEFFCGRMGQHAFGGAQSYAAMSVGRVLPGYGYFYCNHFI